MEKESAVCRELSESPEPLTKRRVEESSWSAVTTRKDITLAAAR